MYPRTATGAFAASLKWESAQASGSMASGYIKALHNHREAGGGHPENLHPVHAGLREG